MSQTSHDLARLGYNAYGEHTGHLTHDGQPLPSWADLSETTRDAWTANAAAIEAAVTTSTTLLQATPQQPSVGRIVLVSMDPLKNNGTDAAPAVITRVWSATTVNVRVLPDATPSEAEWRTSVTHSDSLDGTLHRWTWPPRT